MNGENYLVDTDILIDITKEEAINFIDNITISIISAMELVVVGQETTMNLKHFKKIKGLKLKESSYS